MRFQIVGIVPATLQSTEPLRVVNLGITGALVEGPLPLQEHGEYLMQLVLPGHVTEVTAKVRRVTTFTPDAGAVRYQIGLEFLGVPADTQELISGFIAATGAQA